MKTVAVISYEKTLLRQILTVLYYLLLALAVGIGIFVATNRYTDGGEYVGFSTGVYVPFYTKIIQNPPEYVSKFNAGPFFSELLIMAFLIVMPMIISLVIKMVVRRLRLLVDDDGFEGVYFSILTVFYSRFVIPIEQVSGIEIYHGLFDAIVSGEQLIIMTPSKKYWFPLVQNAKQVEQSMMNIVRKYKGNYGVVEEQEDRACGETSREPNEDLLKFKEMYDKGKFTSEEIRNLFFEDEE